MTNFCPYFFKLHSILDFWQTKCQLIKKLLPFVNGGLLLVTKWRTPLFKVAQTIKIDFIL